MAAPERRHWVLLIHALPARPLYLRARIRRMLHDAGAAAVKQAVYALPADPEALERMEEIARVIRAHHATAYVCEATFSATADDVAIEQALRQQHATLVRQLVTRLRIERGRLATAATAGAAVATRVGKLRERFTTLRRRHTRDVPGTPEAEALLRGMEATLGHGAARGRSAWTGLTWVTRRGVHADRIACAWVVTRFLDPAATFRFVTGTAAEARAGEMAFDMPGAPITHEDGGCSIESLLRRAKLTDPALARIAEIVHDIDIQDERFGHPETAGVRQLLLGIVAAHASDVERLARGGALFDDLHASLNRSPAPRMTPPRRRGTT
jgi:hypothetical protein